MLHAVVGAFSHLRLQVLARSPYCPKASRISKQSAHPDPLRSPFKSLILQLEQYARLEKQDTVAFEAVNVVDMSPKTKQAANGHQEMIQQLMFDPIKEVVFCFSNEKCF